MSDDLINMKSFPQLKEIYEKMDLRHSIEISELQSRLAIAEKALREVRDHEHCNPKSINEGLRAINRCCEDRYEFNWPHYVQGQANGHRCCAAICSKALEEMENK